LMAAGAYYADGGIEPLLAAEKAESLAREALETIKREVSELLPYLDVLVGTVSMDTRLFTPIPFDASEYLPTKSQETI